jgi:hypothetical protein
MRGRRLTRRSARRTGYDRNLVAEVNRATAQVETTSEPVQQIADRLGAASCRPLPDQ